MPIIADRVQPISVLFGQKDLVLDADIAKYFHTKEGAQKEYNFKSLNICSNLNGPVKEGVTQEELREGKSDPVIRLSFSSDESIDNLINQLSKLREAYCLYQRYTYSEVLEETINFYSKDPNSRRAVTEDGYCNYFDRESGNMCAVGRYLKNPDDFEKDEIDEIDVRGLVNNIARDGVEPFEFLLNESTAHLRNLEFWARLQSIHDCSSNWNKQGLSEYGKTRYEDLVVYAENLDQKMKDQCEECFGERFILSFDGTKLPCRTCGAL